MLKRKYWRRSSRWRAALVRTNPNQLNYWRLQALADNRNPLGGFARSSLLFHRESDRMSDKILAHMIKPSPWMQLIDPVQYFGRTEAMRYAKT